MMVKLPRDMKGVELARKLGKLGYKVTRQSGSHIILTTEQDGENHVCVPAHASVSIGTLNDILRDLERHHGLSREIILRLLFG